MLVSGFANPRVAIASLNSNLTTGDDVIDYVAKIRGAFALRPGEYVGFVPTPHTADDHESIYISLVATVISPPELRCISTPDGIQSLYRVQLMTMDYEIVDQLFPWWCAERICHGFTVFACIPAHSDLSLVMHSSLFRLSPSVYHYLQVDAAYVCHHDSAWMNLVHNAIVGPSAPLAGPMELSSIPLIGEMRNLRTTMHLPFDPFAMVCTILFKDIPGLHLPKALMTLLLFATEPVHVMLVRSSCPISALLVDTFSRLPRLVAQSPFAAKRRAGGGTAAHVVVPGACGCILLDPLEEIVRTSASAVDAIVEASAAACTHEAADLDGGGGPLAVHSMVGVLNLPSAYDPTRPLLSQCGGLQVPAARLQAAVHAFPIIGPIEGADDATGDADAAFADWFCATIDATSAIHSSASSAAPAGGGLWLSHRVAASEEAVHAHPLAADAISAEMVLLHVHQMCAALPHPAVGEDACDLIAQIADQAAAAEHSAFAAAEWRRIIRTLAAARARAEAHPTVKAVHVIDVLEVLRWATAHRGAVPQRAGRGPGGGAKTVGRTPRAHAKALLEALRAHRAPGASLFTRDDVAAAARLCQVEDHHVAGAVDFLRKHGLVLAAADGYQVLHWSF